MEKKKIVTFGEVLLRLSKPDNLRLAQGHVFSGNYGGSEANAAVSLATLGNQVEYVTRMPDNAIGRACQMRLREYGLKLNHVALGGERLGTYYFEEAAAMRNSSVVYDRKDSSFYTMAPGMIPWTDVFRDAQIFHCSGITCAISRSAAEATMEAVCTAEEMGLTVACDINYRKNLWNYGADAHETLAELAGHADIIFGDQGEYEVVSGLKHVPFEAQSADYGIDTEAFLAYMQAVHELFPKCKKMVLACRNQLSSSRHLLTGLLFSNGTMTQTRIYDIDPVVDPMGVGDAFMAAYLHAWRKWGDEDQRCLDFSLAASALKNSVTGDFNLVTEEEIMAVMNGEWRADDLLELQ
ncbi:MAG: sugar kinase [Prevotella sp.]|nr:sugar kinase [Prevotella sp.]